MALISGWSQIKLTAETQNNYSVLVWFVPLDFVIPFKSFFHSKMHLHWMCLIEIHLKHVFFSVSDSSLIIVSSLTIMSAMNDIDNSVRESSLFDQLHQHHTGPGVTLWGLHQTGVACDKGHGEHLQVLHVYWCIYSIHSIQRYHAMVTS